MLLQSNCCLSRHINWWLYILIGEWLWVSEKAVLEEGQIIWVDGGRHFCVDLQRALCINWLQFSPPRGKVGLLETNSRRKTVLSRTTKKAISYMMCNVMLSKPVWLSDSNGLFTIWAHISSYRLFCTQWICAFAPIPECMYFTHLSWSTRLVTLQRQLLIAYQEPLLWLKEL